MLVLFFGAGFFLFVCFFTDSSFLNTITYTFYVSETSIKRETYHTIK